MPASTAATNTAAGTRATTRKRGLLALAVVALIVVPAALSYACGPNRAIQLDRFNYGPGDTVTVTGANFVPNASISIKMSGSVVATATTSPGGNFSVSFAAPTAPGTYTIVADGVDPDTGNALPGTGSPQTFTVTAPPATVTPSPSGAGAPSPAVQAPATVPGAAPVGQPQASPPAARAPRTQRRAGDRTSGRERSRSGAGRQVSSSPRSTAGVGVLNTTEGVIETPTGTAFAGSVSRADLAAAADRAAASKAAARKAKARADAADKARPTTSTATGDLWSGFASSKNPSLMPTASDSAPAAGTSTGVVVGLALLGLGALSLAGLGSLTVARRRKARGSAS